MNIDPWDEEVAIEWLKSASYRQLLEKWRYEPSGSKWFAGEVSEEFERAINKARILLTVEEVSRISREVGWNRRIANRGSYDERYRKPEGDK